MTRSEDAAIDDYIVRHQLSMSKTKTGLRYRIIKKGSGPQALAGKLVSIEYLIRLVSGDTLYTSAHDGLKSFVLGKAAEISGLEEGIFLLQQGDEAKFIIPSHLAFGLAGDDIKVPRKATLLYDVKIVKVK